MLGVWQIRAQPARACTWARCATADQNYQDSDRSGRETFRNFLLTKVLHHKGGKCPCPGAPILKIAVKDRILVHCSLRKVGVVKEAERTRQESLSAWIRNSLPPSDEVASRFPSQTTIRFAAAPLGFQKGHDIDEDSCCSGDMYSHNCVSTGSALDAHFGLGKLDCGDVTVTLLDGRKFTFPNVKADRFLELNLTATTITSAGPSE
jgi:hypothetical protein